MVPAADAVSIHDRSGFYRFARHHRDRAALIVTDGPTVTFGELADRVNALSHGLRALGLGAGDVVAAAIGNSPEYFELALATAQVGMYFVPINPHSTAAEIAHVVRDSEAGVLILEDDRAADWPGDALPAHRYMRSGSAAGWLPYETLVAGQPITDPLDRVAGSFISYTSGTTGRPKGVAWPTPPLSPEEVITRHMLPAFREYGARVGHGVHLTCLPLSHPASGGFAICFLHFGHTIVIAEGFEAQRFLRDVERYEATSSHLVPTQFHRLLRLSDEISARYDLSSLELLIHGGAPCPILIKQKMLDWLGPIIWEYFGSNEGWVSRVSPQEWIDRPGTVGKPLRGTTVAVVDDEGYEVPPGEAGTIYFGTERHPPYFHYQNDADRTAAVRRGNLVTVGDYGYLSEDGYIFLLDRRADLIVSRGVRICPAEIEQYLMLHPAVSDAAVVDVADGDDGHSVLAVIQAATATPNWTVVKELRGYCDDVLDAGKRPDRYGFLADFPRTESGKLQRHRIREMFADMHFIGAPTGSGGEVRRERRPSLRRSRNSL